MTLAYTDDLAVIARTEDGMVKKFKLYVGKKN